MAQIRHDLSNEEYHKSDAISSSAVKSVLTSSLFHWKNKSFKATPAMDLGTVVHDMILEAGENSVRGPETRRGKAWTDLKAECDAQGKTLLTEADYDAADDISIALMADPQCAKVLAADDGIREASLFAECPETGLKLRCRPDIYVPSTKVMGDVKTCRDASPRGFGRQTYDLRYDVQGAFYMYVGQLCGWDVQHFTLQAVENTRPHGVCMHILSDESLELARKDMFRALHEIAEAQQKGEFKTNWPSFNMIHPPAWMVKD
jgi:hypothetical protein